VKCQYIELVFAIREGEKFSDPFNTLRVCDAGGGLRGNGAVADGGGADASVFRGAILVYRVLAERELEWLRRLGRCNVPSQQWPERAVSRLVLDWKPMCQMGSKFGRGGLLKAYLSGSLYPINVASW